MATFISVSNAHSLPLRDSAWKFLEWHLAACGWEGERIRNQKESKGKPSREGVCKAPGESEE